MQGEVGRTQTGQKGAPGSALSLGFVSDSDTVLDTASGAHTVRVHVCVCVCAHTRFLKLGSKQKGNQTSNRKPTCCGHSDQEEVTAATVVAKEACGWGRGWCHVTQAVR